MEDILKTRQFESLIFELRGYKVMIDADLAALYETETKRLKEQVKRNRGNFPDDFMFELTKEEKNQLVANCDRLTNLKHSSANHWPSQNRALPCFHRY
ncbi:MAG: ORF6N domain-containing protein [Daejeonella sp.]|uniref:ORF6N domain-containing protein n=1 Tax=Daejeonella sp. JGW-45 TaxID=3034148 RepID=UPI0023EBA821|nr:ORF6N domain-containing protein [Daejeonella sp. JGW-45]